MNPTNVPAAVNQAISGANELVAKGITGSSLASNTYSTGSALIVPQNLSPLLTNIAQRETSFYDRVQKTQGFGKAAEFNVLQALFSAIDNASPRELLYADGGLPQQKTTQFANVINPYRDLGLTGSVTGRAARQEANFTDLEALEVKATMRRVMQAIDWLSFWSDTTTANSNGITGYAGLDSMIQTNVIDAQGAPISKLLLDRAAKRIYYKGGAGYLSHIFCSAGVGIDLDNIFNTSAQVQINNGSDRSELIFGNRVAYAQTIAGKAEIVPNYFINPGTPYIQGNPNLSYASASSGPNGVSTSTVFLLPMEFITYEQLLPMSKIDLAVVADRMDFMVISSGAVTLRAEPFCAKIINVGESVN